MSNIVTNYNTHQIGESINNVPMLYADKDVRDYASDITRRERKQFSLDELKSKLKNAIADQDLAKYGLKVGDYATVTHEIEGVTKTFNYVIAGLNTMKGTSTPYRLNYNHVGLVLDTNVTHAWNSDGTTTSSSGYANSELHTFLKSTILPIVKGDLGAENVKSHNKLLTIGVNANGYNRFGDATGCSSNWTWSDESICALSEVQVYGSTVWSSSGYDTGEACRQLDVFRVYNMNEIFGGRYPWLRDVASASDACYVGNYGYASHGTASCAYYVAALILFA